MPGRGLARRVNARVFLVGAAVILADEATKAWARGALHHPRHLFGPLGLHLEYNSGISFSLGAGHSVVWSVLTLLVALALLGAGTVASPGAPTVGFGLMIGGGVANLVDRLSSSPPRVTDFVALGRLPVFNLADLCVSAGFVTLVVVALRGRALVAR